MKPAVERLRLSLTVCVKLPLDAVTAIVYDPVGVVVVVEIFNVETPDPPEDSVTLTGLKVRDGPLGEMEDVRVRVPANPARLEKLIVDVADDPGVMMRPFGFAVP